MQKIVGQVFLAFRRPTKYSKKKPNQLADWTGSQTRRTRRFTQNNLLSFCITVSEHLLVFRAEDALYKLLCGNRREFGFCAKCGARIAESGTASSQPADCNKILPGGAASWRGLSPESFVSSPTSTNKTLRALPHPSSHFPERRVDCRLFRTGIAQSRACAVAHDCTDRVFGFRRIMV
jgi:hypothetical protein